MKGSQQEPLARSIQTLFQAGTLGDVADGRLVERFLRGDEHAFRHVVERHAVMVMGVCKRVLGDTHEAEDASQAAFLVLARRARSIRSAQSVGPWLFQVAYRIALRARKSAARRRLHEQKRAEMDARRSIPGLANQDVCRIDAEIHRLPIHLQAPLVLCHLEGLSQEQAAKQLGQPLRTLQRRLTQARERLRIRLIKQGIELPREPERSKAPFVIAPAAEVPSLWIEATTKAALTFATKTALTNGAATMLAQEFLRTTIVTKITTIAAITILLGGTLTAGIRTIGQEPGAVANKTKAPRSLTITVVDETTREPIEGASVTMRIEDERTHFTTNSEGKATMAWPDHWIETLELHVQTSGHVPAMWWWMRNENQSRPSEATIALERGTTIGGRVVDETGNPVPGATATILVAPRQGFPPETATIDIQDRRFTTDATGKWRCDIMPGERDAMIKFSHPDFVSDRVHRLYRAPLDSLRNRSEVTVMKKGIPFEGTVLDDQGQPIAGAAVTQARTDTTLTATTTTDAEGRFRYSNLEPGLLTLMARAPGRAPDIQIFLIPDPSRPHEFRLKPGQTLRGRVTTPEGEPVAGVRVVTEEWRDYRGVLSLEATTDASGRFRVEDAPEDEVELSAAKAGFMKAVNIVAKPGEETAITLIPFQKVRGKVLDAQTHQPILKFTLKRVVVFSNNQIQVMNRDSLEFAQGRYETTFTDSTLKGHRLIVEANGYLPAISPVFGIAEGDQTFDFEMTPTP